METPAEISTSVDASKIPKNLRLAVYLIWASSAWSIAYLFLIQREYNMAPWIGALVTLAGAGLSLLLLKRKNWVRILFLIVYGLALISTPFAFLGNLNYGSLPVWMILAILLSFSLQATVWALLIAPSTNSWFREVAGPFTWKQGLAWGGGTLAVIAAIMIGFTYYYIRQVQDFDPAETTAMMEKAGEEGKTFGQGKGKADCAPEGIQRISRCDGLICQMSIGDFMKSCLATAADDPKFCEGVPKATEVAGDWPLRFCKDYTDAPFLSCSFVAASVMKYCAEVR